MTKDPRPLEYIAARSVLLDALRAIRDHLDSLVLVGAQAVYLHTGPGGLPVPVMTTDADLALDVTGLRRAPEIGSRLREAGFVNGRNPGQWLGAGAVEVDLMVVPHQGSAPRPNSRGARIPPHEKATARITAGLEPALVDHAPMTIDALDPSDPRQATLKVAGPAALLVAKLIKIGERVDQADRGRPQRLREKDALDGFRLLQSIDTADLVAGLARHASEPNASRVCQQALSYLREHGASPEGRLPVLAGTAALDDPTVPVSFAALARRLIMAID